MHQELPEDPANAGRSPRHNAPKINLTGTASTVHAFRAEFEGIPVALFIGMSKILVRPFSPGPFFQAEKVGCMKSQKLKVWITLI